MGYPMTFRRVVSRNWLREGGYNPEEPLPFAIVRLREEGNVRLLLGDLRRFEQDVIDGGAIAQHIAEATDLPIETVNAVLRSFMDC